MIEFDVPGRGLYRLEHVVIDVNGTLTLDGQLVDGVGERLARLRGSIEVHLVTADTRGRQDVIDTKLGVTATRIAPRREAAQKAVIVQQLGAENVCAIGNGANDSQMLQRAGLAIAVMGDEGLAVETLNAADAVTSHITAALDLLLDPRRLVATLRR